MDDTNTTQSNIEKAESVANKVAEKSANIKKH